MQLIAPNLVAGSSFNFKMSKEDAKFKIRHTLLKKIHVQAIKLSTRRLIRSRRFENATPMGNSGRSHAILQLKWK